MSDSKLNATESPKYFLPGTSPIISLSYFFSRRNISNKLSVEFAPGRIIRWRKRRFVVVDCTGFEAIIAREVGKRRLERIPVAEAQPDHSINQRAISVTNLVAVPEDKWQTAVRQFTVLKRLLEMDGIERTRAAVEKVAKILKKHPATIYRWIESYNCSGRLSELLRKNRADRGKSRLSSKVDTIIEDAIKKIYLTAEQPHISAVIEEVIYSASKLDSKSRPLTPSGGG